MGSGLCDLRDDSRERIGEFMKLDYYKTLDNKIKPLDELIALRTQFKKENKTVVTNNGSYDILHLGHVMGLFEAKAQGDILIVGVNTDQSIKSYKGPDRPINPEQMRLRMLAALSCVDYVFLFNETTPLSWLDKLKPDIHTNGAEYGDECIERDVVEKNGGKIHLLKMIPGFKTTDFIKKIRSTEKV